MSISPEERQYILAQVTRIGADQLNKLWAQASRLSDIDFATFITEAFPELVDPYSAAAADLATDWYNQSPSLSNYTAVPGPLPLAEQLTKSASWALGGDGTKALDRMQGTLQRAINDSARDTIVYNTEFEPGARWARHASANACAFCKLMATRGAVYRTEADALTVRGRSVDLSQGDRRNRAAGNGTTDELLARRIGQTTYVRGRRKGQTKSRRTRGSRALGDKYHDHCHCVAIEIRPGASYEPPPYVDEWNDSYARAARESNTKGEYGAVDLKAVLSKMRSDFDSH